GRPVGLPVAVRQDTGIRCDVEVARFGRRQTGEPAGAAPGVEGHPVPASPSGERIEGESACLHEPLHCNVRYNPWRRPGRGRGGTRMTRTRHTTWMLAAVLLASAPALAQTPGAAAPPDSPRLIA